MNSPGNMYNVNKFFLLLWYLCRLFHIVAEDEESVDQKWSAKYNLITIIIQNLIMAIYLKRNLSIAFIYLLNLFLLLYLYLQSAIYI